MTHTVDRPSRAETPAGRRRAVQRHRRTRPPRLRGKQPAMLGTVAPVALVAVLAVAVAGAFGLSTDRSGPLPQTVTLAALLTAVVLLTLVARRLGLGVLATAAAIAFAMLTPPAVRAAAIGVPEHLAVLALLGAVLLLLSRRSGIAVVPVAGALAGAAVAVAPLAMAAVPFLLGAALRGLRRGRRVPTLPLAGAAFFAVAGVGWAVLGLDITSAPRFGGALLADWAGANPVGAVVAVAAIAFGLLRPTLRPLSGFGLTVLALGVWPEGDEAHRLTVLLAPALGLLVGAATEKAVRALALRSSREFYAGVAGAVAVGAALLAGIAGSAGELGRQQAVADSAAPQQETDAAPDVPGTAAETSPRPAPASTSATVAPAEVERRASSGRQLVQNPRLTVSAEARALLESGQVDRRIPVVLAQFLTQYDLTVADFPATPDEEGRRQVLVSAVDGAPVAPGDVAVAPLTSFLTGLTGSFIVESVTVAADGVLAVFPPADPAD